MFIHTDILRAALCCVAGEGEERDYLKGIYITPTHIKATNGKAAVAMEHGSETDIDAVFILHGDIPEDADGTNIGTSDGGWFAIHYATHEDDESEIVGSNQLELIQCRYPDFNKLLPENPETCDEFPMFAAQLLGLPCQMFPGGFTPVKLKPYGKAAPCQLILDPITNHLYGNPFLVIMPVHDNAFDMCAEVINEKGF